ncbi:hypothetical protein JXO52_13415 [bacterium]|nr:hypothetical protein [bacterium]
MEQDKATPKQESAPKPGSGKEKKSGIKSEFEQIRGKAADFAHKVGDRAPDVAESVVQKTKKVAGVIVEKTEEAVVYGKLKLQLHNQKNQLSKDLASLGSLTFELLKKKDSDIHENNEVKAAAEAVKKSKKLVADTEKKVAAVGKG